MTTNLKKRSATRTWLGLTLLLSALLATNASAKIINVPADTPSIQVAIVIAAIGDEIVVAQGVYFEQNINLLGKAITVRSTDPSNPAVVAATIVLGGTVSGPVFACVTGEGPGTVISGLTIANGNNINFGGGLYNLLSSPTVTLCTFTGNGANAGGGMFNLSSNPTVIQCTFEDNQANAGGGMFNDGSSPQVISCVFNDNTSPIGGGMFNQAGSNPTLNSCTFSLNFANEGGGVHNDSSSPVMVACVFDENTAPVGGGMFNDSASSPTVNGGTFSANAANDGGGMYNRGGSSPALTGVTFSANTANNGSGIYNTGSSNPVVTGVTFSGNTANISGGGIYNTSSNPAVIGCNFTTNSANAGGGIYNAASSPIVGNSTFRGNTAQFGGGMVNDNGSNPLVSQCTFDENQADVGGGIFNQISSSPALTGSIFIGNVAAQFGGAMYSNASNALVSNSILWNNVPDQIAEFNSTTNATYNDIAGGFPGNGNINADPMFVDAANRNYRLRPGSPCIDAANNSLVAFGVTEDLDGNPRFVDSWYTSDTGVGTAPIVDMGSYENQATSGPVLTVSPLPLIGGQRGTFTVTDARNNVNTFLWYSLKGTGETFSPPLNVTLDLRAVRKGGNTKRSDANGSVQWRLPVTAKVRGRNVWLQVAQKNLKTDVVATSVQ